MLLVSDYFDYICDRLILARGCQCLPSTSGTWTGCSLVSTCSSVVGRILFHFISNKASNSAAPAPPEVGLQFHKQASGLILNITYLRLMAVDVVR